MYVCACSIFLFMWHPLLPSGAPCTSPFLSLYTFHLIWFMVGEIGLVIFNLFMYFPTRFAWVFFPRKRRRLANFSTWCVPFLFACLAFFGWIFIHFFLLYFVIQLEFKKQTAVFRMRVCRCANEVRNSNCN